MSSILTDAIKRGALRDGVTFYSNVEPIAAADKVLAGDFVFPYVGSLPVWQNQTLVWRPNFGDNSASKALWFYSLVFIDYLVKASVVTKNDDYWHKALQMFESYRQFRINDPQATAALYSDEHAVTNRACVLSQMLHVLQRKTGAAANEAMQKVLLAELAEHADWLVQDEHYVFNNHGIMMDKALLNLVVHFREIAPDQYKKSCETWLSQALRRIKLMLNQTFDEHGCCTENSPSYHMLNLNLFGAINSFVNRHQLAPSDNSIAVVLKKAIAAAAFQVYEDGSLPLIGDSESKASVSISDSYHKGKFGTGYFPEAGFCIIKQPGFHFTFKCGGSSFSHRHIDDTSITLRVDGLDFICDGGMYSYDNNNEIRQFLKSYKAHSGFFTESCSNVRFSCYSSASELAQIVAFSVKENIVKVEGSSFLDPDASLRRKIELLAGDKRSFDRILITDMLCSEQCSTWRQQFVLHPDVKVNLLNNVVTLQRHNVVLTMSFNIASDFSLSLEKGFYSTTYQKHDDCNILVVSGKNKIAELTTLVVIS